MSTANFPEKIDPKPPSTIESTSTQFGNSNLNVKLNRNQNQPQVLSSDSDIEFIPPEKNRTKKKFFEKVHYCFFFPSSIPWPALSPCN